MKPTLIIYECSGAACDNPIFRRCDEEEFKFSFDTYGMAPQNLKKWKKTFGYGACGGRGFTNDIAVVAEAIIELNKMDRVGQCEYYVSGYLEGCGFKIKLVKEGFR